ncbi:DgyrCDS8715 [Dimorphilus gyrociliatus]|uniref:glutathione transferase n=1 Tax=Dimorphilus gyrociliatus TaxID=2664684 RepID=A0A7I8VX65_9ANNE|nr:DgyrCDS8715 [Dimorphilus gyrociliatus]
MAPVLGYWKIRGLAQPIRLMLKYCNIEFEDKYYECGPAPDFSRECWLKEKFTLGLDFPNLPYYIDGDVKLTQSRAILHYIGKKHGLCGKTDEEQLKVCLMTDEVGDFRSAFTRICYGAPSVEAFESMKVDYLASLDGKLQRFEDYLKKNESVGKWLAGENLSYADFYFYEILDHHRIFKEGCLDKYTKLTAYMKTFEELPAIKEYLASKEFLKYPLNNKIAKFGGN